MIELVTFNRPQCADTISSYMVNNPTPVHTSECAFGTLDFDCGSVNVLTAQCTYRDRRFNMKFILWIWIMDKDTVIEVNHGDCEIMS